MFEDFFAGRILPCKLSESIRWIVIYVKEYFHVAGLLYIFTHAVFKLLTYNNKSAKWHRGRHTRISKQEQHWV